MGPRGPAAGVGRSARRSALLVFVQGGISRSSAPPPDEVAALRHELANAMTAIAGLAAQAQGGRLGRGPLCERWRASARWPTRPSPTRATRWAWSCWPRATSPANSQIWSEIWPPSHRNEASRWRPAWSPGCARASAPRHFGLVVWNLLKNAIEASPPNSVVVVSGEHRAGSLRLAVEDRGAGLSLGHAHTRVRARTSPRRTTAVGWGSPWCRPRWCGSGAMWT
jgi:hypothetical protein